MLKAGALYFSIVIAFFIAVLSASLIMLAAHYRASYLKDLRIGRLYRNMDVGIAMALRSSLDDGDVKSVIDLYDEGTDSIAIAKTSWGIFNLCSVTSFVRQDSLSQAFLMGLNTVQDSVALVLADEDRPLSVSGDTRITGNALLPKSGIKKAYVEGKPYSGDAPVNGIIHDSERKLTGLREKVLEKLREGLETAIESKTVIGELYEKDVSVSFTDSIKEYRTGPAPLSGVHLKGRIKLLSDTTITISGDSQLENVVVFAPAIKIQSGFKGNAQFFARDSIVVEDNVSLEYPSVFGLIAAQKMVDQAKISIGKGFSFKGIIFSHEDKRSALQTMISMGEGALVTGEVYATGMLKLSKGIVITGKASCNRFIMQTKSTLYENFLVDVTLDRRRRSRYYLGAGIFNKEEGKREVLKWLN